MVHDGSPVQVQAQLNDVRYTDGAAMAEVTSNESAVHPDAPAYTWWLRIRFELSDGHGRCMPVHKVILMYPPGPDDFLGRYNVGNTPKVFTWAIKLDVPGGTVRPPAWTHNHHARYAGYILLRGNHSLNSLVSLGCISGHDGCETVEGMQEHLLLHVNTKAGAVVLCVDKMQKPDFVEMHQTEPGMSGMYDRPAHVECRDWSFYRGQVVTVVSFSIPKWATAQHQPTFS